MIKSLPKRFLNQFFGTRIFFQDSRLTLKNQLMKIPRYIVPLLIVGTASASTLSVNLGPETSDAEAGFDLLQSSNSTGTAAVSLPLGSVGGVSVLVSTGGSATDNRFRSVDRGDSTAYSGPFDQLTEGWIGTQTFGSALTISLTGVDAGTHTWTSYHFDNGTGLSGSGNQNAQMLIELSVDGGTTFSTLETNFQIQDNEGTATSTIVPFSTDFTAVAGQDVQVRFTASALGTLASGATDVGQDFTVINGFSIEPSVIPEPSSALLGLLAGLGLLRRRR